MERYFFNGSAPLAPVIPEFVCGVHFCDVFFPNPNRKGNLHTYVAPKQSSITANLSGRYRVTCAMMHILNVGQPASGPNRVVKEVVPTQPYHHEQSCTLLLSCLLNRVSLLTSPGGILTSNASTYFNGLALGLVP